MTERRADDQWRLSVFLAAVGLLLSLLLLGVHAQTYLTPAQGSFCTATSTLDCAAVAASPQSIALGLPWAVWGSAGFVALLQAARTRSRLLLPLSGAAALVSLGLFLISLLQLGALCLLCELVHVTTFALLVIAIKSRATASRSAVGKDALAQILGFPALLLLATWIALPRYWVAFSYRGQPHLPTGQTPEGEPFIGAASPRLVVHEFTDYQCPHCKVASTRSLRLLARYPDVQLVRHDTPRMSCEPGIDACRATRAAICAEAQGKFWQADRWLFAFANPREPFALEKLALDLKLDPQQLESCFESKETYAKATAKFKEARAHKARFVPSYWIDGKRVEASALEQQLKGD